MKIVYWISAGSWLASLMALPVLAQNVPPANPQTQVIQQEEQRQRERERARREERTRPPVGSPEVPLEEGVAPTEGAPCLPINSIRVDEVSAISASSFETLFSSYELRCLGVAEIQSLIGAATNIYLEAGYVTTRVVAPEQDLTTGTLLLRAIEGRIDGFDLRSSRDGTISPDRSGRAQITGRGRLDAVFPADEGDYLNLRDLEQAIDQINARPSNDARLELAPGNSIGGSTVVISNTKSKFWRASAGVDNTGSRSTGETQGSLRLGVDGLLGLYDGLDASYRRNLGGPRGAESEGISGSFTVPYGYWTLSGSVDYFRYRSPFDAGGVPLIASGNSVTGRVGLDRLVHRDQTSKTTVGGALILRQNRNFIEDALLQVSSRDQAAVELSASHSRSLAGGALSLNASWTHGLHTGGPIRDALDPEAPILVGYDRIGGDIRFTHPFETDSAVIRLSAAAVGQWSPDDLYTTDQISIGGLTTVRGFKDASISGDTGGYLSFDLGVTPTVGIGDDFKQVFGVPTFFAGFDVGALANDGGFERGTMAGAAFGVRLSNGPVTAELVHAIPIISPSFINSNRGGETYFRVGVTY